MAITFPANQGSQGLVSEASGALNIPPRGSERDAGPEWQYLSLLTKVLRGSARYAHEPRGI